MLSKKSGWKQHKMLDKILELELKELWQTL
jgi:hypothetical protein